MDDKLYNLCMSKLIVGCDHAGFEMKEEIKSWLFDIGYEVEDVGARELAPDDDYPDYTIPMTEKILADKSSRGVFFGGSGQGEAMCANRHSGIRAGVYYGGDLEIIRKMREHNNTNVLSIGARFININEAKEAIKLWINTKFPGDERHVRRLSKF